MSGTFDRRRFMRLSALAAASAVVRPWISYSETPEAVQGWQGHAQALVIDALGAPGRSA